MKILHGMVEIAGQASFSVKGLKENNQNVRMATYYSSNYPSDICVCNLNKVFFDHEKKYLPLYLIKIGFFFLYSLVKFDVFHFHFGTSLLPKNLDLVFLKFFRKKVFFEFHGSDLRTLALAKKNKS